MGATTDPAVVVTETVTLAGFAPLGLKGFGETAQNARRGDPFL
jgi:hypothetical protein